MLIGEVHELSLTMPLFVVKRAGGFWGERVVFLLPKGQEIQEQCTAKPSDRSWVLEGHRN
jgi:hypothetical protein